MPLHQGFLAELNSLDIYNCDENKLNLGKALDKLNAVLQPSARIGLTACARILHCKLHGMVGCRGSVVSKEGNHWPIHNNTLLF